MGRVFDDYRREKMKDPDFRKEYEALEPEFRAIRTMIEGRERRGDDPERPGSGKDGGR